jgi:hypothetical protein
MLLCFISTTFWQCQKEEFETTAPQNKNSLNISVVHGDHVFQESPLLRAKVTSLKKKNTAARLTSSLYNFSIDEEHVQIITGDDYTQYTFNIERENPTPNLLENYVCKIYTDGEVFQYLMGYPYTIGQNGIAYQMQNSTIEAISDGDIVVTTAGRGFPPGCVPEFLYEILTYECTNYSCSGDGRHMPGEECPCGTPISPKCNQPYTNCGWITTAVYGGCGGGGSTGGDGGFTPPAGGGSGGSGTTTPVDPVVTVPFEIKPKSPCVILQELMNPTKQNIVPEINWLKNLLINGTTIEHSSSFNKKTNQNIRNSGTPTDVTILYGSEYVGSVHLHPISGYPIFSWADLRMLLNTRGGANAENFMNVTLMIVTPNPNDPTNPNVYALFIQDSQELLDQLNNMWFASRFTTNGVTDSDATKLQKIHAEMGIQYQNNKNNLEAYFLEYISNFGISLYKANNNVTSWSKLELSNLSGTQIAFPNPCN